VADLAFVLLGTGFLVACLGYVRAADRAVVGTETPERGR